MGTTRTYSLRTDYSRIHRLEGGVNAGSVLRIAVDLDYTPPLCVDLCLSTEHRLDGELCSQFCLVPVLYPQAVTSQQLVPELVAVGQLQPELVSSGNLTTPGYITGELRPEHFAVGVLTAETEAVLQLTAIYCIGLEVQSHLAIQIQLQPQVTLRGGILKCPSP